MSPAPSHESRPARPRRWPWLLAGLLLTVFFLTPPREAYDHTLDRSNYATYVRFFAERAQWGDTVLPMTGPYGFILYGHTYSGELTWLRLIADLLLKAAFVALALRLVARAGAGAWRWVWLAGVVAFVPRVDDLFHDFAILTATLSLLVARGRREGAWTALAVGLLGFLALFKGTHLLTASLCFGAVLLQCAVDRRGRDLARLAAGYAATVVGSWCLAGQDPAHLPGYVRAVLELSSGYNAAMGLSADGFVTAAGFLVAALLAVTLVGCAAHQPRSFRTGLLLVLLAGFSFIKWKHGFLRADGHVSIFFTSAIVIALTAGFLAFGRGSGDPAPELGVRRRRFHLGWFTGLATFAFLGSFSFHLLLVLWVLADTPARLLDNARFLARPGKHLAALEAQLARNRREAHVPQIRNEVGEAATDFFGYEQGLLLLNDLTYTPRPMGGGSFNVFTPWLQERNEAFVRDPRRAPPWQVMRLQTLDHRFPAADDPLTLRAILHGYSPVLLQRDYLLLQRRPRPEFPAVHRLETRRVAAGEAFTPPDPGPDRMLLFTIEAPLSLAGRLRAFLYRPPGLTLHVEHSRPFLGRDFRLWPVLAQRPVILSPLLLDNADVIDLYGPGAGNRVERMSLQPEPGYDRSALAITFYTAPRPLPPESGDVAELKTYHRFPLHNRPPASIDAPPTGITELNKEPITSLHAPGSATWDLQPGDQQFIFSYGMMPRTYLEGDTDGVEFTVELLAPDGGRILFQRMLRPRTVPADQGMQRARLFLPPYRPDTRLRVRVHPGQDNNANYDQAYLTRVQLKSGPLVGGQFSGLGVVPASRELPAKAIAGIGDRPVYLVHAPDEVILDLPAGAREFAAEIGLLPGAYTGGGASDGVEYTLSVIRPDGRREVVATRLLNPRQVESDRGPQGWRIDLPAAPAGSRLSISTGVGPNGDRGWDQSYIAGVSFR